MAGPRATTTEIPLFPLRTVLFPGGVLPLKVFEQRYIEMVSSCLKAKRPFGVVMISAGDEVAAAGALPSFADVGTLARIADVEMPQLGIMHVATEGLTRFRVRAHRARGDRLIVADVSDIADEPALPLPEDALPLARLLELAAARVGPRNFPARLGYEDASWVGYRLAELLPLPLAIKQSMLEINDADVRLKVLAKFLAQQQVLSAGPTRPAGL